MRIRFLVFFFLFSGLCQAQIFDPKEDWFTLAPFFQQDEIANNNILQLHIKIQSKKDGEAILKYSDFLQYDFDDKGQMVRSEKSIQLGSIIDTACFIYQYNADGMMICRKEIQRNMNYSYQRFYDGDLPYREIKLDESKLPVDTLINRRMLSVKDKHKFIIKVLNDKGLPFMVQTETYRDGKLNSNRTDYIRNQNYQEVAFGYEDGKLIRKSQHSQFGGSKDSYWIFSYEKNQLASAIFYNDKQRSLKRIFTYGDNGLMKDVIERNYIEKSLKIYYFSYKLDSTPHGSRLGKWN